LSCTALTSEKLIKIERKLVINKKRKSKIRNYEINKKQTKVRKMEKGKRLDE
jgi:hypothetical protein